MLVSRPASQHMCPMNISIHPIGLFNLIWAPLNSNEFCVAVLICSRRKIHVNWFVKKIKVIRHENMRATCLTRHSNHRWNRLNHRVIFHWLDSNSLYLSLSLSLRCFWIGFSLLRDCVALDCIRRNWFVDSRCNVDFSDLGF